VAGFAEAEEIVKLAEEMKSGVVIMGSQGRDGCWIGTSEYEAVPENRRDTVILVDNRLATAELLDSEVDELVCLEAPSDLMAIGLWYEGFYQVSDEEVVELDLALSERCSYANRRVGHGWVLDPRYSRARGTCRFA
jgi:hypothetical protein